jgi:hypothetical protein
MLLKQMDVLTTLRNLCDRRVDASTIKTGVRDHRERDLLAALWPLRVTELHPPK